MTGNFSYLKNYEFVFLLINNLLYSDRHKLCIKKPNTR